MTDTKIKESPYEAKVHTHDDGMFHIEVSIPWERLEPYRSSVLKHFSTNMKVPGFRDGHVPESVVQKNIKPSVILEEMAEMAIREAYPRVIEDGSYDIIGRPHISITKLAEKNPLEFNIQVQGLPQAVLPDYKSLAGTVMAKQEEIKVDKSEIEDTIAHIRREWAKKEKLEARAKIEGKKPNETSGNDIRVKDDELPEFNDDFAKKIGPFEGVEDFRSKLEANILSEKTARAKDKLRGEILDGIRANTKLTVPDMLIEAELDRMVLQFKADVERLGMKFEEYLKHSKKSEEDMRKEWRPDAEKYAKNQIILNKIAVLERVEPESGARDERVEELMKAHKDAKRENVLIYVDTLMRNDMVLEFLEKQE